MTDLVELRGHTPGPWRWRGEQLVSEHFTIAQSVRWWNGDREANARLIAKAPELLDRIETLEAEKANLQSNVAELCDAIRKMRDHPMCPVEVGVIGDAVLAKIRNHARAALEASHHVELVGALWSAKRLIENINEFGVVTDVEFVDEADSRIGSALALIDHA